MELEGDGDRQCDKHGKLHYGILNINGVVSYACNCLVDISLYISSPDNMYLALYLMIREGEICASNT